MNRRLVIISVLFLLPATAALGAHGVACHAESGTQVFDGDNGLVVAANDVSVSRFTYDDNRVTRAETLIGEAFKKGQCR